MGHPVHQERFGKPGRTLLGSDSHTPAAAEYEPWNSIRLRLQKERDIWNQRLSALEAALTHEEEKLR